MLGATPMHLMELHEGLIFVNLGSNCSLTLNLSLKNNKLRRITRRLGALGPTGLIPHGYHELISKVGSQILNKLTSTSSLGNGAALGLSSVCCCFLRDEGLEVLVPTAGRWSKINLAHLGRRHSYCRKWWNGTCRFRSALGYAGCPSATCTALNGKQTFALMATDEKLQLLATANTLKEGHEK